jgi:hypothetical protein
MTKPKVPGTTDATNREQRRARERGKDDSETVEQQERRLSDPATPPDVTSVRAKSSRHGKSTADKWNQ